MILVDGNNFLARYFFQLKLLEVDGKKVGGMYGFLRGLYFLVTQFADGDIFVVWDGEKSKERRRQIFADYKNTRLTGSFDESFSHMKSELITVLYDCVGVKQVMMAGYEADDVVAYLSRLGDKVYIVSTDRDFWQLISDKVKICLGSGKVVGPEELQKETGCVNGKEFLYCKALAGDSSDGIPGVKGVGMKRALQIVRSDTVAFHKDIFDRNMLLMELNVPVDDLRVVCKKSDLHGFVTWCMTYRFQGLIEVAEDFLNRLEVRDGRSFPVFRE